MIVVTGADGFIGSHLCKALRARGDEVFGVDLKSGQDILTMNYQDWPDADRVYHLAAQTDAYNGNAYADAQVNIMGSLIVFHRYREKVVITSSAMVNYPVNPYAISKKACEDYARYFNAAIVRLPNVYGPGGHSFIDKCEQNSEITIFGSGNQLRTWCHVDDVVLHLLKVRAGELVVVDGEIRSINQIAGGYGKPILRKPARDGDLLCATQL